MKSFFNTYVTRLTTFSRHHKIWASIIVIAIIIASYGTYSTFSSSSTETQYTLSAATIGTITQTVTGTGQVSAQNQLDITSKISGMITSINVSIGDKVHAGDLLATIDSVDAFRTLQSAQISYAKLVEPAKSSEIAEATSSVIKAYDDGFNAVADIFTTLPNIVTGTKDLLYSQTGFLSDQQSSYLSSTAREYRDSTGKKYDKAFTEYNETLNVFRSMTRNSPQADIDALLSKTYTMVKDMADAITNARNTITFITTSQSEYHQSESVTAAANVNSWSNTVNSAVTSVISAQNSIRTNTNSLVTLTTGTDALDLQAGKISLEQAQQTYSNYFIRAPFDGIVGKISGSVYGQAGSSALITLIGDQKVSTISLNEIDAAKVKQGQPVTITFDAIDDFNATGTVSSVDLVGTVSSGVVTYNVKILINTNDDRIRPGMSLNATIITEQKENVLTVPSSAIKTKGSTTYVQVLDVTTGSSTRKSKTNSLVTTSETKPREITITIGSADDTNTEIMSGLNAGQYVVTKTATVSSGTTATTASGGLLGNLFGGPRQQSVRSSSGTTVKSSSSSNTPPPGF